MCRLYVHMQVLDPFQVTEQWMSMLNPDGHYTLTEELQSGDIVTHRLTKDCEVFSHDELVTYVTNIWLHKCPPELIICPTSAP